jgi:hypothetical protein
VLNLVLLVLFVPLLFLLWLTVHAGTAYGHVVVLLCLALGLVVSVNWCALLSPNPTFPPVSASLDRGMRARVCPGVCRGTAVLCGATRCRKTTPLSLSLSLALSLSLSRSLTRPPPQ